MNTTNWSDIDDDGRAFLAETLLSVDTATSRQRLPLPSELDRLGSDETAPAEHPTQVQADDFRQPNSEIAEEVANIDLARILHVAIQAGASDVHITANMPPHLRVNGSLRPVRGAQHLDEQGVEGLLLSHLTPAQRTTLTKDGDLDLAMSWHGSDGQSQRFRVSLYRQSGSYAGAFRIIAGSIPTIEDLGLPAAAHRLANLNQGLVLVTGRTGSGKSTTLAAIIQHINTERSAHIVTIEDPIEYRYRPAKSVIQQREVGLDTVSFSSALRHALRQDPDVILIGELRDLETIRTALTAAETGHLVLATLHSSDTSGAVNRIIDVFPGDQQPQIRSQVALSLQGILSQELVPSISGGLIPATEVLIATSGARNMIREDKLHQLRSLLETGGDEGMHTFDQSLAAMVRQGRTSLEFAMRASRDPANLESLVAR